MCWGECLIVDLTEVVSGDGNVVNTGNHNAINSNVTSNKGDLGQLASELRNQGIDDNDIAEITEIVQIETPTEGNKLGSKAINWISKIVEKSLSGVGKIATGVSSNLLAAMLKGYCGIE